MERHINQLGLMHRTDFLAVLEREEEGKGRCVVESNVY
jgi:hypothetical protein